MLLYTTIKKFMEVLKKHVKCIWYHIVYKVMGWFDGQYIGVEQRKPRFNPLYQHILHVEYAYLYI
jgi:hypothetical protein